MSLVIHFDCIAMANSDSRFLMDAEKFLAEVREYKEGDLASRMELLKQLELLKRKLEQPIDNMMNQWISVRHVLSNRSNAERVARC